MFIHALLAIGLSTSVGQAAQPIFSVTDISHEFLFYFDGRFAGQYLQGQGNSDARNWGTLHKCDISNANLLVLQSGGTPCPYLDNDISAVRGFLNGGGGVLVLGDFTTFRDEKEYRLNTLARAFGAEFVSDAAKDPLKAEPALIAKEIKTYHGGAIRLTAPSPWEVLMRDADGRTVMARRKVGNGRLLVASRALCGHNPDSSDPINAEWWTPLLRDLSKGKKVDPARPPQGASNENSVLREGLQIRYNDYMREWADAVFAVYKRGRPVLERILGVPPSPNMLTSLILLPTGGGGFSNGHDIALGVWWGDFPKQEYGMVELLGHESTHSWVLPFAEPMWNEGIATYVGIQLGRELGLTKDAEASLNGWIEGAKRADPGMKKADLAKGDVPGGLRGGKCMWIMEQLRNEKPDVLARYFRAKRKLADPAKMSEYTADDCVAVLSVAMGRDLFPWFRSLGITVDRPRTKIPMP